MIQPWKLYAAIVLLLVALLFQGCSRERLKRENAELYGKAAQHAADWGKIQSFLPALDVLAGATIEMSKKVGNATHNTTADDEHWRKHFALEDQLGKSQAVIALLLRDRGSVGVRGELNRHPPDESWWTPEGSLASYGVDWLPAEVIQAVKRSKLDEPRD